MLLFLIRLAAGLPSVLADFMLTSFLDCQQLADCPLPPLGGVKKAESEFSLFPAKEAKGTDLIISALF